MSPLVFNALVPPFDQTFTAEEGTVTKAKKPLNVVAKEIELEEGQLTNAFIKAAAAIEESKLSLPEVIKKLTVQTVEAEKKFETPEPAEVSTPVGTASTSPIIAKSGKGGKTSSATNATGGNSGKMEFFTGEGASATTAAKLNKGGATGSMTHKTGNGGEANSTGEKNEGGFSGNGLYNTGTGGPANGESTVKNTGGASGTWTGGSGSAGEGKGSKVTNEGGSSGAVTNTSGAGGIGQGATATTLNKGGKSGAWTAGTGAGGTAGNLEATGTGEGGASGEAKLQTGAGGAATNTAKKSIGGNAGAITLESGAGGAASGASETNTVGKGGNIRAVLGDGGGATEASSGAFQVYYQKVEASKLRFEITNTGLTLCKKGLTAEGATKLEGTAEVKELLTAKKGLTVEGAAGELKLPGRSITSAEIVESVGLEGVPTAPTAALLTNTTQIATTAFVQAAAIARTGIVLPTGTLKEQEEAVEKNGIITATSEVDTRVKGAGGTFRLTNGLVYFHELHEWIPPAEPGTVRYDVIYVAEVAKTNLGPLAVNFKKAAAELELSEALAAELAEGAILRINLETFTVKKTAAGLTKVVIKERAIRASKEAEHVHGEEVVKLATEPDSLSIPPAITGYEYQVGSGSETLAQARKGVEGLTIGGRFYAATAIIEVPVGAKKSSEFTVHDVRKFV